MKAKPFVKWVGGKTQLLEQLEALLPADFDKWENVTYIEPFVGGGAMLFYMLQKHSNITSAVINDINADLTTCYMVVKNNPDALIQALNSIQKEYYTLNTEESKKEFFLQMRDRFNTKKLSDIENTTLFFFLNRTCFNGLYRVNKSGLFNVPFGRYQRPTICDPVTIYSDSELLQKVEILTGDFEKTMSKAHGNTFFYLDPPYRPLNNTSNFNDYSKEAFNDREQVRLRDFCHLVNSKKFYFMLSNSDSKNTNPNDSFFDELYSNYQIRRVYANRMVNANAQKRGKLTELLIDNFSMPNYIPIAYEYSSYKLVGQIERKVSIDKIRIDKNRLAFANEISDWTVNNIVNNFHLEGWEPISVDSEYYIRDGQHRLAAAKKMGLEFIDVLMLNDNLDSDNKHQRNKKRLKKFVI